MRRAAFALTVLSALSALAGAWAASPAGDQPDRTWQEPASTWHAAVTAAVAVSETSGLSTEPATETQEAPGVAGVAAEPSPKPFVAHPYPSPADLDGREWSYFRETGHYVSGGFKRYFDAHGGVDGLGYPITEELSEDGWTVQYFQRARLEYHPDAPDAPVQRSLLGDMLLALRQGVRIEATFRPLEIVPDGARVFPETGYAVASPALEFFTTNGGLAAFGYPVSRAEGGAQWFQRARLEWVDGVVQAAPIGEEYVEAAGLVAARTRAQPPHLGRVDVRSSQVRLAVHRAPGSAEVVTRLPRDAQVQVTGEHVGPDGDSWYAVRLWNTLDGFVERRGLAFTPAPLKAPGAAGAPWKPEPPPAQGPFPLSAQGRARIAREFAGAPDGPGIGSLAAGVPVRVMSWATDAQGRAWYQFGTGQPGQEGASGWILAGTITLDAPDPLTAVVGGKPVAQTVAGKGMWFTYDVLRETPAAHLVATAQANGFSFLAPQVGTSRRGYWARGELDALLPAAHAAGLKVIPWVYPWLVDLPGDLDLALAAAWHVAPGGHTVDGVAVDVEENLDQAAVRVYGQLLRAHLGPDALLIAITYPPQNVHGRRTPYATLAESFNVIVPMSYWHLRNVPHAYGDAYAYVAESVRLIRQRAGRPDVPIAVVGQTFDWFTRSEIGAGNPTGAEVRGAMQAARDAGALGIGFFNWFSATPEEWAAIGAFPWAGG